MTRILRFALLAAGSSLALGGVASAQQTAPGEVSPPQQSAADQKPDQVSKTADAAPAAPASFWSTFKVSGHVEAGMTLQPDQPDNGLNFGHLFTDRANEPLINQVLLTAERPIDSKAAGFDFGFRLQALYGSDARYTRFTGEFKDTASGRQAFDIVEANLQAHLPVLTKGGIDVKVGQYASPLGLEVIAAPGNPFYSHSYIYNFGLPFKHTGVLTTTHVSPLLDIYAGVDSGVNTALGDYDNNGAAAVLGGFGLNFSKVTVIALTHIGPENPRGTAGVRPNKDLRYLNDVLVTWKVSDKLTSTTEFNYIRDDGFGVDGGGAAQYLAYALTDHLTLNARGEVWRDAQGFFVAAFPYAKNDYLFAQEGLPYTSIGGGRTTYGAVTLGLSWKPARVPKLLEGFVVRPEVRYDRALNDTRPFRDGRSQDQFTIGLDIVAPFTLTR